MRHHGCTIVQALYTDDTGEHWGPCPPMKFSNIWEQRAAERDCKGMVLGGNGHHLHENHADDGATYFCCDCGFTSWETFAPLMVTLYNISRFLRGGKP